MPPLRRGSPDRAGGAPAPGLAPAIRAAVEASFRSGVRSGVNGTPTCFINGVRHDGRWDVESLVDALAIAAGT